jgi:hypothetical protein
VTVVIGLDLAISSTGIARFAWDDAGALTTRTFQVTSRAEPKATLAQQVARMVDVRHRVLAAVDAFDPWCQPLVAIEGPATGLSSNAGGFALWGLWWQVVADLHTYGCAVAVVSPSTLKVYATGFGGSAAHPVRKPDVQRAVAQRYPQLLTGGSHDVADAIVLAAMAARAVRRPIDDLPSIHLRAMEKPKWPTHPLTERVPS